VATPLGFEPRITPPKGAVLPLHHGVCESSDFRFAIFNSSAMSKIRVRLLAGEQLSGKIEVELVAVRRV
jgi:hypothetical protein